MFSLLACEQSTPLPDMEPGEQGRVVRVIDGDALVLNTGQSVRLVGIEAPVLNRRRGEPDTYAEEAARALENMVMGREVQLYYPGLTRDRYDRALAHVVTTDAAGPEFWVNMELVRRGAARVRLYPDTAARGDDLMAAEQVARDDGLGLWGQPAYAVMAADEIAPEARGFMIIGARLEMRTPAEDMACLWSVEAARLRVRVEQSASAFCNAEPGRIYRLRGWVSGNTLTLTHPLHAQRLE